MKTVSRLLTVVGTLVLLAGTVAGVVNHEVLDAGRFADHVNAVRADPAVSRELGALVTDRILAEQPDLTAVRPLLESTATAVVASPALGSAARAAAAGPLYRTLTGGSGTGDTVVLRLADVGAIALGVAAVAAPEQRAALPAELDVRLSQFGSQDATRETLDWVHLVRWLSWLLPVLGVLLLALGGAMRGSSGSSTRGRALAALAAVGRGALAAAVILAAVLVVAGFLVGRADDSTLSGAVLQAVWHELDGDFWAAAGLLGAVGYVLSLAMRPGVVQTGRDLTPREVLTRAWGQVLDPGPGLGPRAVRAGVLLLTGIALVLQPLEVARALLWATGVVLVVLGGALLVAMTTEAVRDRARGREPAALLPSGTQARWVAVGVAVLVLVGALVVGGLPGRQDLPEAMGHDDETCNGYVALCERAYDDVAFPATHNSMSAADEPGWFFAEQPDGIIAQLDHGIRVLLVDSWYGQRTQRRGIVANTDASRAAALEEAESDLGRATVDSALRLRDALDLSPRGPVEPYLCHALCELGSTAWLPVMKRVRDWMAAHPRDVVTVFVQDTVSPADTADVFRNAGLLPYVYTPAGDHGWPTLGQMIESGQRLVVLMENHGGGTTYPWLMQGFDWVQDTPYDFARPSDFSCAPNRGPADASVFLLNHWITDKRREVSNATEVNARDVLLPRAQECAETRGLQPTYLAVDFYDRGDLFGVVDTLNGTG
ncbi:MAG TPA: hypothetical protein VH228_09520 [Nocardioides sp.]|nr:hypothetical protein [Nocardioides sp.]